MRPRKTHSRRLFARAQHTPYHGADRRFASGNRYFGLDRRRARHQPAQPLPPKPREPLEILHQVELGPPPSPADIALRAELLFRQSGCLPGRDLDNWLTAEADLRREARQAALERHHQALAQWQKMLAECGLDHPEAQDERLWLSRLDRC